MLNLRFVLICLANRAPAFQNCSKFCVGRQTNLLENSGQKSEQSKYVVVGGEGVGDTDDDHCPLTEEKDRLTTEDVGQNGADHSPDHHADDEDCLCEVLEICARTDQVPLQNNQHALFDSDTPKHTFIAPSMAARNFF